MFCKHPSMTISILARLSGLLKVYLNPLVMMQKKHVDFSTYDLPSKHSINILQNYAKNQEGFQIYRQSCQYKSRLTSTKYFVK